MEVDENDIDSNRRLPKERGRPKPKLTGKNGFVWNRGAPERGSGILKPIPSPLFHNYTRKEQVILSLSLIRYLSVVPYLRRLDSSVCLSLFPFLDFPIFLTGFLKIIFYFLI